MTSQVSDMTSSSFFFFFFWRLVPLVQLSYWSKFHVNITTGSGITAIFFYKGLTRNPEIGSTSVWVFPNIWRRGELGTPNLARMSLNKMLLNTAECQGYSFCSFWVIKGKPIRRRAVYPVIVLSFLYGKVFISSQEIKMNLSSSFVIVVVALCPLSINSDAVLGENDSRCSKQLIGKAEASIVSVN